MKVNLITDGNVPADYEQILANGAMIICGPCTLETLAGLKSAGVLEGQFTVGSEKATGLALPDRLMIFALLLYCHRIPGITGRGPTRMELADWRQRWLASVSFAQAGEPEPAAQLTADAQTDSVILQLSWSPTAGRDWQGVRSTQVKRVALALETAALAQENVATAQKSAPRAQKSVVRTQKKVARTQRGAARAQQNTAAESNAPTLRWVKYAIGVFIVIMITGMALFYFGILE